MGGRISEWEVDGKWDGEEREANKVCAVEQITFSATEAQSWGALGNSVKCASVIPVGRQED